MQFGGWIVGVVNANAAKFEATPCPDCLCQRLKDTTSVHDLAHYSARERPDMRISYLFCPIMRTQMSLDDTGFDQLPHGFLIGIHMPEWLTSFIEILSVSWVGLPAIFAVCLSPRPALLPRWRLNRYPRLCQTGSDLWVAILVATVGNTLGGMVTYFIGYDARTAG